ncbi:CBS domain protein [Candidatus Gugararchaeum adminiculabundum]|nr:CBS domain protein [Candidatus Gugararchaeum adminiculabundum]
MLPELTEIGKRRRKLGLKQAQLARLAQVSQSMIAKIESGKIDPSFSKTKQIFEALEQQEHGERLTARDILTKNIISVNASEKLTHAIGLMKKHDISQLPVFSGENVVGSITEETILEKISSVDESTGRTGKQQDLSKLKISDVMDEPFPRVTEDTPSSLLGSLLAHSKAVLIVRKEKIIGIVTKADLLKTISA